MSWNIIYLQIMQFTLATHIFTEHLLHAIYCAEFCIYFMFQTELSFIEEIRYVKLYVKQFIHHLMSI